MAKATKSRPSVLVTVKDGVVLPMEGRRRQFFQPETPTKVPLTSYIRRRLACGDLVKVKPDPANKPATRKPRAPKES